MPRIRHQSLTPHRLSRRRALQVGSIGLLSIADLMAADSPPGHGRSSGRRAERCILIWLDGGPSHIDTFDPKPEASQEVRGPFDTISTSLPGIRLSSLMPEIARRMGDVAIVRSMTSPLGEHNLATHYVLTGYQPTSVLDYPSFPSVLASRLDVGPVPPFVAVPNFRVGGSAFQANGFLPPRTRPFEVQGDPDRRGFRVPNLDASGDMSAERLGRRREYLSRLDSGFAGGAFVAAEDPDSAFHRAFELIESNKVRDAFALEQEDEAARARYGSKTIGQSCLVARRLVERGCPLVTVNDRGWDTHQDLVTRLKDGFTGAASPVGLVPSLDRAVAALIDDLKERHLLDSTLVIVMGEFGRTPKLNSSGGRDHWPRVFSILMAGGPVRGGTVIGSSDSEGESPRDSPTTPMDLAATIYHAFGLPPSTLLTTPDGRPVRLVHEVGQVIPDILSV